MVNQLMRIFKESWAENGDYISIQYAGTDSTSTNVTLNGKEGFSGMIKHSMVSLTRFYIGNFSDEFKQKCIDYLLQRKSYNNTTIRATGKLNFNFLRNR